jgi:hypothetical protein
MRTACELAHITQLDFNQAAFWLGSIASNTDNLQMPFATKQEMKARADNGTIDPFWPKGVLRMQGEANYTAFTNYTMNLGLNINSTSNTQFVANNHIMSYLSGLFLISSANTNGDTCLSLTSAGKIGECIAMLDQSECQDDARLMHHLFNIKLASGILGCEYNDSEIVSFECPKQDCVAPAIPTPSPTECADNNGTSVAPATPSPTECADNNSTSVAPVSPRPTECPVSNDTSSAPATTAPVIVSPATNQTCNETSVAPMTPAPTTPEPTVKLCHKCEIEQIVSPASTNSMLTTLPLFAIAIASLF